MIPILPSRTAATLPVPVTRQAHPTQGSVSWQLTEKDGAGDPRAGQALPSVRPLGAHEGQPPPCWLRADVILLGLSTQLARFDSDLELSQAPVGFLIVVTQLRSPTQRHLFPPLSWHSERLQRAQRHVLSTVGRLRPYTRLKIATMHLCTKGHKRRLLEYCEPSARLVYEYGCSALWPLAAIQATEIHSSVNNWGSSIYVTC